ncbi:glucan biosynthesis protein G [Caldimonas brevitalea]|uniref:glucan biosynthesis protein G n=1 Tax=Caldimonas brevitalea TaxID=413882 RepID=UPI003AA7B411
MRSPLGAAAAAATALTLAYGPASAVAPAAPHFDFEQLTQRARALAQAPFQPSASTLPQELKALDYDQYRDIRFRPERALWRGENLPFEVMFFHLGKLQTEPVLINEITPSGVRHVTFKRDDFDYGKNRLKPETWGDVGFGGFRVHYPLNTPRYKDELVVFLGASYFRALGGGQRYGLSARGLAIDTVGGQREEFPRFKEFWIRKPAPNATSLTVYGLLDSPRAAGAYEFEVKPGGQTLVDVRSRLFLRSGVATLGVAPLTSMFMFGENQPHASDFRPEVHDSDGLMVATGEGEWIWRPLVRPQQPLATSFQTRQLRGFGLMQRDRAFSSYEDTEARYELRPSAWITPQGEWGPGRVELVQLPAPDEANDNIVAYWVPAQLPAAGQPLELAYQIRWQGTDQQRPPGAWVTQTRTGRGFHSLQKDEHQFIVDFTGPSLAQLPEDAPVKAVVTAGPNGRIVERNAYRNDATGAWRLALRVHQLQRAQPLELRAYLQHGNDILTETWSNIIPPQ